jgi:hypothetical protein
MAPLEEQLDAQQLARQAQIHEGLSNFYLNARFATEPAAEGSVFSPERIGVWPPLALRRWLDETAAIYAGIAEKMAPPEAVKA